MMVGNLKAMKSRIALLYQNRRRQAAGIGPSCRVKNSGEGQELAGDYCGDGFVTKRHGCQ
jgi:hypothetical protein